MENDRPDSILAQLIAVIHVNAKFELGHIVISMSLTNEVSAFSFIQGLLRHSQCDWGNVGEDDQKMNDHALENGGRIMSIYSEGDTTFWIITEADRSATTALLPDDY